jgi:hypothetical protein
VILHVGRGSEEDARIAQQRLKEDEEKTRHFLSELRRDPVQRSARFFNRLGDAVVARAQGKEAASMPVGKELQALYAAFELPFAHRDLRAQADEITQTSLDLRELDSSEQERSAQEKLDKMLEPFGIRINFGSEEEFSDEEAVKIVQRLEQEMGRTNRRRLQYFTPAGGVSVLEARKDRINTRHLPPIRKFLQDFAYGAIDAKPTDTGYPGVQKLSFPVEGSEYWAFLTIDEAEAVEILEIGGERMGNQVQEDFKQAVANKIAHQRTLRAELKRLQDRQARNVYFLETVTALSQGLADAANEIAGALFRIQRVCGIDIPHEDVQEVGRDLARLYKDKKAKVNADILARWVAENLDTEIPLPQFTHSGAS